MCGIAGYLNFGGGPPADDRLAARMIGTLAHRGPDDEGVWVAGPVALASRRLAIIDLSAHGHQPMANEDRTIHIAYNGEVYNFQSLRAELEARGHAFRSHTDTETIVHLYEEEGPGCVARLRGMFAFAIWDAPRRRLVLARDRVGKKPLFYYCDGERLVFGSEPKALHQHPGVPIAADPEAVDLYLTYGYVPGPHSAFTGLRKLPPGHYLVAEEGRVRVEPYWRLRYQPKRRDSIAALTDELRERLREAVRLRMISDVPVGALLSGGVDSSAVVAMMRQVTSGPLRTFSIGFDTPEYDELEYARLVATRFATEHHELVVRPDVTAMLPRLVWHYNEPFADSSALPSFAVCQLARTRVTVALNGDGGDEAFIGYDRYLATAIAGWQDRLPAPARRAVAAAARRLPLGTPKSTLYRLRRFAETATLNVRERYARWLTFFDAGQKAELLAPAFAAQLPGTAPGVLDAAYALTDAEDIIEATAHADIQTYLPDDLLVKMDIASMAHSLELRSPLLDHELLEFAATLPVHLKVRGLTQKYLLKRAIRDLLPAPVTRRRKMGFGVPLAQWFRAELRDLSYDVLLSTRALQRGYFRPAVVRRYLDEHNAGTAHHHFRLWNLLMLELWHEQFIDRPPSDRADPARVSFAGAP